MHLGGVTALLCMDRTSPIPTSAERSPNLSLCKDAGLFYALVSMSTMNRIVKVRTTLLVSNNADLQDRGELLPHYCKRLTYSFIAGHLAHSIFYGQGR